MWVCIFPAEEIDLCVDVGLFTDLFSGPDVTFRIVYQKKSTPFSGLPPPPNTYHLKVLSGVFYRRLIYLFLSYFTTLYSLDI